MESTLPACYAQTPFMHSTPELRARIAAAPVEPRRLPAILLGRVTLGALLAVAALLAALVGFVTREAVPPVVTMGVVAFGIAAAIAAGRRLAGPRARGATPSTAASPGTPRRARPGA